MKTRADACMHGAESGNSSGGARMSKRKSPKNRGGGGFFKIGVEGEGATRDGKCMVGFGSKDEGDEEK